MDIDATARALASILTDPSHPMNQLKRPARRKCRFCDGKYTSRVSILCEDGLCSEKCRELQAYQDARFRAELEAETQRQDREAKNRLLAAIFGMTVEEMRKAGATE